MRSIMLFLLAASLLTGCSSLVAVPVPPAATAVPTSPEAHADEEPAFPADGDEYAFQLTNLPDNSVIIDIYVTDQQLDDFLVSVDLDRSVVAYDDYGTYLRVWPEEAEAFLGHLMYETVLQQVDKTMRGVDWYLTVDNTMMVPPPPLPVEGPGVDA